MFCVCLEGATTGTVTLFNNIVIDVYNGNRTDYDVDECIYRSLDRNASFSKINTHKTLFSPTQKSKFSGPPSWAVLVLTWFPSTCPGAVSRLAAPPPSASHPPPPSRPPLMERMRKIKRQLSLTLGRGGAGGGDRMLSDTINQEVTSHSDSGNTPEHT